MNIAIITGASSGIGKEYAILLDRNLRHTDEIWLIARNKGDLNNVAAMLTHKNRVIALDLTNRSQMLQFQEVLAIAGATITVLVNCAGFGKHGMFEDMDNETVERMLELNTAGLTRMTKYCLPYLKKGSRIIQLASGAAFLPQSGFAVYAASKAYVYSFSRALGSELKKRGIIVTTVCPGPVDTPFLHKAYDEELCGLKKMTVVSPKKVVQKSIVDSRFKRKVSVCGLPMRVLFGLTQSVNEVCNLFTQFLLCR